MILMGSFVLMGVTIFIVNEHRSDMNFHILFTEYLDVQ